MNHESHPPSTMVMIMISLDSVNVRWKVGCLLEYWVIVGLVFCSILAGYYSFPGGPDFRWLWLCSWRYLKSLLPPRQPALDASIFPSQQWHTGSSCCRGTAGRVSEITKYIYGFDVCIGTWKVVIGDRGLSLEVIICKWRCRWQDYFLVWDIFWGNLKNCSVSRSTFSVK